MFIVLKVNNKKDLACMTIAAIQKNDGSKGSESTSSRVQAATFAGRSVEITKTKSKGFFSRILDFFKEANKPIESEANKKPVKAKKEGDLGIGLVLGLVAAVVVSIACCCCAPACSQMRC